MNMKLHAGCVHIPWLHMQIVTCHASAWLDQQDADLTKLSNKLGDGTNWHGSVGKVSTAAVPLL